MGPRYGALSLSTGAARRYRDSDRWISSIICDGAGNERRDLAMRPSSFRWVDCIQRGYLIVLGPSYLRRAHGHAIYYRADRDLHSTCVTDVETVPVRRCVSTPNNYTVREVVL